MTGAVSSTAGAEADPQATTGVETLPRSPKRRHWLQSRLDSQFRSHLMQVTFIGSGDAFGSGDRVGVYLYTRECVHHDSQFHARMFAPASGIYEDPATGGAAAAFAGALMNFDGFTDGTHQIRIEQGIEMGRPSFIDLAVDAEAGSLKGERIGGHAVLV
eukprot:gene21407-22266_t